VSSLHYHYVVPGDDFIRAGEASGAVKKILKQIGISPEVTRKVAIALYEGEINQVIHAYGGEIEVEIAPDMVSLVLRDTGPGIPDIEQAMEAGYSTADEKVRNLGFGAGMGLPNIKKNTDALHIESTVGVGTTLFMKIYL
jgi:anti-sigma regulatory factor (Ser/Thr protein kinase)